MSAALWNLLMPNCGACARSDSCLQQPVLRCAGLAGIEFIFFRVKEAGVELWFGFVLETVDNMGLFHYC